MRTVAKALTILDLVTEHSSEWGLSEIARVTGIDRATCYRMLSVLLRHGYVSKAPDSKKYSLGATVLRLARTREASTPVSATLHKVLETLTRKTTETSHASLIAGFQIATVASCDGPRNNRVHVEPGARMELHATASGLACAAYADAAFVAHLLDGDLPAFTPTTVTDAKRLKTILEQVRAQGFSVADRSFDADVVGIAAPVFGKDCLALGSIAVATPASRMSEQVKSASVLAVMEAAVEATRNLGGVLPEGYLAHFGKLAA